MAIKPFPDIENMLFECYGMLDQLLKVLSVRKQSINTPAKGAIKTEPQITALLNHSQPSEPIASFEDYFQTLQNRIEFSPPNPFIKLCEKLQATDFELLLLLLALAVEYNQDYEKVFAYLQGNAAEKQATVGLAIDLYGMIAPVPHGFKMAQLALGYSQSPLRRYILRPFKGDIPLLAQPLRLRQSVLRYIGAIRELPPVLQLCALQYFPNDTAKPITHIQILRQAVSFSAFIRKTQQKGLLQLVGDAGSGKKFTLRYIAHHIAAPILVLDCQQLASYSSQDRQAAVEECGSTVYVSGSMIALLHIDTNLFSKPDMLPVIYWLLDECQNAADLVITCSENELTFPCPSSFLPLQLELPPFTIHEQKNYWEHKASALHLPIEPTIPFEQLAGMYSLTPGQIDSVLSISKGLAISSEKKHITIDDIATGVRLLCRPRLSKLAEPLSTHFTWEDLKLEPDAMETFRQLCQRIHHRYQVNQLWGFDKKLPYGRGLSVLLYGPPGTGKTMAAQVLAKEFGLDAYRVDISRIMDKYIGETEKKLAQLFDAAKDSNAILFFDEADALFSKRTDVGDAKDKYANAATAYLLQRMESHNGVSILATNIAQSFDEAFKRRISFMIPLMMPSNEIRLEIWQSVFPQEAPVDRRALPFFAEQFELSGSSIKSIALTAAYMAAQEGTKITRACIIKALKQEAKKSGRVIMEHELY